MGTRSLYGIGAHYIRGNVLNGAATFDLLNPNILLFHGDGPDAKFAGVSYTVADEPEGFTGDEDVWHSHSSVCRQGGSIVSLSEEGSPVWLSESECTARGGQVFPLSNAEMMHLWIGPDYIDRAPIFAHDHPDLYDGYNPKLDAGPVAWGVSCESGVRLGEPGASLGVPGRRRNPPAVSMSARCGERRHLAGETCTMIRRTRPRSATAPADRAAPQF